MEDDFETNEVYADESTESYLEQPFDAFRCPLSGKIMRDPVTIETGQTFEREAILNWFRECQEHGRKPTCPLTKTELASTNITPSLPLKRVIDEWRNRNEAKRLERAHSALTSNSEQEYIRSLQFIINFCRVSQENRDAVRRQAMTPLIATLLRNTSRNVRLKALEALEVLAEGSDDNKEAIGRGDTIRTIIRMLTNDNIPERELAASLLCELSTMRSMCELIGGVPGAILRLAQMASSNSEHSMAVDKADMILRNMENYDLYIKQMADSGRLQPLLTKLLEGPPEEQVTMANYLGELRLPNDAKVAVAEQVGKLFASMLESGNLRTREATLNALREISSGEASARILLSAGILPPLVNSLFTISITNFPMRLKEVSAMVLANLVASGADFVSIPLDEQHQTLLSVNTIHSLLHLINNTGPAIESKLLQVLVGMTSSKPNVNAVVDAIKSSGAVISLIQFIEADHREIRVPALKLLENISPYMRQDLVDALLRNAGHISSLTRVIADSNDITEEETTAIGLLADLPEDDLGITRQLLDQGAFQTLTSTLLRIRQGRILQNRYVIPYTEHAARVLCRITCALHVPEIVWFAAENDLATLFADLLQMNGLEKVQRASAVALRNLSTKSAELTQMPGSPPPPKCCFKSPPPIIRSCRVHGGLCSLKDSFCLVEGNVVSRLVACLDHLDEGVVEAALGSLCTILSDSGDVVEGVMVLLEADGVRRIFEILRARRCMELSVLAVERILRIQQIAEKVSDDQSLSAALVEAYRDGDERTRQTAERALKHLEVLPNYSTLYPNSFAAM